MHWFFNDIYCIKVIFRFYVLQGASQVPIEAEGTEWNVRLCACKMNKSRQPTGANCSAWNLLGTKEQVVVANINVIRPLLRETDCLLFWGSALLFHRFQRPKGKGEGGPKVERPCRSVWECLFACFLKGFSSSAPLSTLPGICAWTLLRITCTAFARGCRGKCRQWNNSPQWKQLHMPMHSDSYLLPCCCLGLWLLCTQGADAA